MANLNISGNNSSYTLTLSGMSTSLRYHVFIADLSSSGGINGYTCLRSSLGTSSNWTYNGSSNVPYSNYERGVYVRSTSSATIHSVGKTYTWSQVFEGTTEVDAGTIPAGDSGGGGGGTTTYKVTVAPNGGTYTGTSPITVSSGGNINLATVSNQISRNNYVLTGWRWSADSKVYSTTAVITRISSNGTITAQWELKKNYYYRVKLYGNGGSFSDGSTTYWWPGKDDATLSETTSPKIDTSVFPSPTYTGYKLRGWAKTSNGTPTSYLTFTATSTNADDPTTGNSAYAIWAARQVLVYDYNGGRYGNETGSSSIYVDQGSTFKVNRIPSKDGYSFLGWKRTYDSKIYQDGQTFTIQAEREVLTAQWGAIFKFRLSDTNEGLVSFQVNRYTSQGGALLESKTISSNINFIEILAGDNNYIEITNAITVVIKDGTKEINRNGFTVPLITAKADSSSNPDQSEYLTVQIPGSVTQSPVYNSYGFRAGLRPNHHTFLVGSFAKNYTYKIYANKGYWTTGTDPKSKLIKSTERVDFSNYSTLIKRFGCDLDGWGLTATGGKVTVPNGKYWITDNTDFYAVWTKNIGLFYWDGNAGTADDSIIAKGLPITNLTAERWNRLREKVLAVANARANITAINKINATSTVQSTNTLTASMFNNVREAIAALEGSTTLPDEVNSNELVLASYFNGPISLKSALNAAIIAWNNS